MEIVSEPDVQSAAEAKAYCQELQMIFRCLDVSDADMEKGHMRCEVNISVQEEGKFTNIMALSNLWLATRQTTK